MRILNRRKSGVSHISYKIIKRSGLFDRDWYKKKYPDIGNFDPIEHYLRHGWKEGRNPSENFDGLRYLAEYEDVKINGFNPLLHWILHGEKEGRSFPRGLTSEKPTSQHLSLQHSLLPTSILGKLKISPIEARQREKILNSGLFDPEWYSQIYTDIGDYDPALHYLRYGAQEGRASSPHFDSKSYLKDNSDVQKEGLNPLIHWIDYGHREGRKYPVFTNRKSISSDILQYCNPDKFENPKNLHDDDFKISIITPTYNTEIKYLRELYNSIINQTYSNWEWVICDDCSINCETINELKIISKNDSRIIIKLLNNPHGISNATNAALEIASGHYIALVDHDDLISRDILELAWRSWIENQRNCDLFYTDECKISLDRELYDFFYKPAWSPSLLENTMYIGHLSIYRRELVLAEGGMRSQYDGTQDYDLALRLSRKITQVVHIPKIGYFWRAIPGSTAMSLSEKDYAIQKQKEAVTAFAENISLQTKVGVGPTPGHWRVDYALSAPAPLMSIVIPTGAGRRMVRGKSCDLLTNCIASLLKKKFYPNMEFIIVHNGNLTPEQQSFLSKIPSVKLVHYTVPQLNLSQKMNMGVSAASGEYVCLLNDDIEAITEHAGECLLAFLETHPKVGAIGPMCLYEDGRVQHNGIVMLEQGPSHSGILKTPEYGGPFNYLRMRREAIGVTGAILITKKCTYENVGGFNEKLPLNYNDVEFCTKINAAGLTCVIDPEIKVYHFESATKIGTFKCEKEILYRMLPSIGDQYFNINYDQNSPYYDIAEKSSLDTKKISFEMSLDNNIRTRQKNLEEIDTLFTIAVSVYNQPKSLLNEMITSLISQTYKKVEIIIHDDASTLQETIDWVESLKNNPRIKLIISEKNRGIAGSQKILLDNATGEYFLPVDGDDFITVDCVEILANQTIIYPEVKAFYSDEFKSDMSSTKFSPFYKTDFDHIKILNCCYVTHQMMFKTDFLREIGAYTSDEAKWCHDWDSTLRTLQQGESIKHVPELLYAWRINPGSTASAETAQKPAAVASQRFVLDRYFASRGMDHLLFPEENKLGPNTGMWTIGAKAPLPQIVGMSATDLWQQSPVKRLESLRYACESGNYVLLLLDGTDQSTAELELSVPILIDPAIKVVGSTLLDPYGRILWSGGVLVDGKVLEPSIGMDPREGGYHGQLYCQRLIDVAAGANTLISSDVLRQVLDELASDIDADRLMIMLAIFALKDNWLTATTPKLEAALLPNMRSIIPMDRTDILQHYSIMDRSPWAGSVPLQS